MKKADLYNAIDPLVYEERWKHQYRDRYLHEHWRPIVKRLVERHARGLRAVDLGCGTGGYTAEIRKVAKSVIGVDISRRQLAFAKSHFGIETLLCDATDTGLPGGGFDFVLSMGLIDYVDPPALFKEIRRLLRKDGVLVLGAPNLWSAYRFPIRLICRLLGRAYPPHEITLSNLKHWLVAHDFRIEKLIMNDALVFLPDFLDNKIGRFVYPLLTFFFCVLCINNPLSNVIVVEARKL